MRSSRHWKNWNWLCSFSPLGQGFLTGTISGDVALDKTDLSNMFPRFSQENRKTNQVLVDLVVSIATYKNVAPAQIAFCITCQNKSKKAIQTRNR